MPGPIRVGIVGTGFGARVHLPAFQSLPCATVTALADSGSGRAAKVAPPGVAAMTWQELVTASDVDAVVVALPPSAHRAVVEAALTAGKSVLCEKPFGMNAAEAQAMTDAASHAGVTGAIGFQFRYEPHLAALRGAIARGEIGAVRSIVLSWLHGARAAADFPWSWQNNAAMGGGILNALASHVIDLFGWLTGSAVASVDASEAAILVPQRRDAQGVLRDVTAEDWARAQMRLANGAQARLEVSNCVPGGQGMKIIVIGEKGRLTCGQRPPFRPEDAFLSLEKPGAAAFSLPIPAPAGNAGVDTRLLAVRALDQDFVDAVSGNPSGLPHFRDGLAMRKILSAIQGACVVKKNAASSP